jgi:phage-related protein
MATLRELMIEIGIDADTQGLTQLEKGLNQVMSVAKAVGVAIIGASAAVFGLAKSTANYADTINDTAQAVGLTNTELQTLGHAAQMSGSSMEEAADGIRFLSRALVAAKEGTGSQADAFQKLGVRAVDAQGKVRNANVVFNELADGFAKMPAGAEKTTMAMELFGRSGTKMIQVLNNGSSGIQAMRQEAISLGLVLDDASIKAGTDFNDAFDRMLGVFNGLKNVVGAAVLPSLTKLVDLLREIVVSNFDIIKQNLTRVFIGLVKAIQYATTFIGFLGSAFRRVSDVVGGLVPLLKTMGLILLSIMVGQVVVGIYNMAKGFIAVAKSLTLVNASAMLLPLLIGGAIVLAGLIIDDFIAWMDGRPSVLGYLIKNKDQIWAAFTKFIDDMLSWIDKAVLKILDYIEIGITKFLEFFGVTTENAQLAAKNIVDIFRWLWDEIKNALSWLETAFYNSLIWIFEAAKPIMAGLAEVINSPFEFLKWIADSVKDVFKSIISSITNFVTSTVDSLLSLLLLPGRVIGAMLELVGNGILALKDKIMSIGGGALSFIGGLFGSGGTPPETAPMTQGALTQGAQNSVNNRTANTSTTVSPIINVTVGGGEGAMSTADDIARRIRDEIAGVAEGIGRSSQPQFAQ